MFDIRNWSFARIALVSAMWIVVIPALVAAYFYLQLRRQTESAGSVGIGAVFFDINVLLLFLVLFLPPIVLALSWYFMRRT
jgi:hypothetical protein